MSKEELIEKLNQLRIPKNGYSLDGKKMDNSYVLSEQTGGWIVFYYERGEMLSPKFFRSVELAYDFIYSEFEKFSR